MKKKLFFVILILFFTTRIFSQIAQITVEDLWQNWTFYPYSVYGLNSMNDGENYSVFEHGKIIKYSYQTGKVIDTLLNTSKLGIGYVSSDYQFNSDETKILIYTDDESIYRWSFKANFYVYDLVKKQLIQVSENGKQQLATFSPSGNKVAFVRENNIFIKDLESNVETKITFDGEFNSIINGAPDWVYEEEFGFSQAYEWSPNGDYIAYIKFNESGVSIFGMTIFAGLEPKMEENSLYPENSTFKYPKAGEDNSIVSVHVFNLNTQKTVLVDIGTETNIYIPRIRWTTENEKLSVIKLNRFQNKFEILIANPVSGETKVIYTEENKYYIEESVFSDFEFLEGGEYFVITSERDGYRHIYLYDVSGNLVKQLTLGNWDVTQFCGYDSEEKIFYYQSAEESPMRRSIYSIDLKGKKKIKLSTLEGTNDAEFSNGFKYYINYFSNLKTPTYVTLNNIKGETIRVLEDNENLKTIVEEYGGVNKEFTTFTTSEGITLNATIIYPLGFDATKKYPVLITGYNGPNSQEVLDNWSFGWENMLAQKGYIVFTVDTRGTGARGEEFRKVTYLQLGKYETLDLIETAKYLGKLKYVDASRIGIWGWSYGGYMALSCMTKGADYFKTGIAVAPVTNWRYYDNIYTERYMRTPQDNATGYDDNSPINYVDLFKGNLLIVHGSADDNVHYQNSMEFTEAMVQAGKQFDMHIYTNRNHSIYGGKTRLHLYTLMTNYVLEKL